MTSRRPARPRTRSPSQYTCPVRQVHARQIETNDKPSAQAALDKIRKEEVSKAELSRAQNQYEMGFLSQLQSVMRRASVLNSYETWRGDPDRYYEDGFQLLADQGTAVAVAPLPPLDWVEVDDHADLARAREVACRC